MTELTRKDSESSREIPRDNSVETSPESSTRTLGGSKTEPQLDRASLVLGALHAGQLRSVVVRPCSDIVHLVLNLNRLDLIVRFIVSAYLSCLKGKQ